MPTAGGRSLVVDVSDAAGKVIERRPVQGPADGQHVDRGSCSGPNKPGVSFYPVQAALAGEEQSRGSTPEQSAEATLRTTGELVTVDRAAGRIACCTSAGRPNWESSSSAAPSEDEEVELVGLVRIAKKEPKFTFRGRQGESTNPLYRGFGNQGEETPNSTTSRCCCGLGTETRRNCERFPKSAERCSPTTR